MLLELIQKVAFRVIDSNGFRLNVGIILANPTGQILWAKRLGREAWQFPQGGMHQDETPEDTLFRELREEIGLYEADVSILARTRNWLRYRIPKRLIRDTHPICIGQKQLWFLLQLETDDSRLDLQATEKPEFDDWKWVNYFYPLHQVVSFKRNVYRRALKELAPYMFKDSARIWGVRPLNNLLET